MPNRKPLQTGWDMSELPTALASFLGTLPVPPQLLALGEPTHRLNAFPVWRNRVFKTLVEDHGYRSIALESDVIAGLRVNAHITTSQAILDDVMHTGFSHNFGTIPANRVLLEWMRDFNADREPTDQVHFYGFDAPMENMWAASPRASLLALHAFLTEHLSGLPIDMTTLEHLCGEDARWTNPAAAMDPTQSIGNSNEARQLRLLTDDLFSLLQTEAPRLAVQEGFWEAQLHARTATGLLRYHAVIADPAPTRVARMGAQRDWMMADNLSAIVEREQARGPTLVFAHNIHLQRNLSTMKMRDMSLQWWGAGAHVSLRLEHRYAFIAGDLGSAPDKAIGEPASDTLEGALMSLAGPATLFSAQKLTTVIPEHLAMRTDHRVQAGSYPYFPLKRQHLPLMDGVLFLQNATN